MQTLEGLRKRIATTEDLRSIVSTMKALSAVSIGQYEKASASLEEYNYTVEAGLQAIFMGKQIPLNQSGMEEGKTVVVVCGSDQGLVGRFNKEIVRYSCDFLRRLKIPVGEAHFIAVGRRVGAALNALDENVEDTFAMPGSVKGLTNTARGILVKIDDICYRHNATRVVLFHNKKTKKSLSVPQTTKMLPVRPAYMKEIASRKWPTNNIPYFTMKPKQLFSSLIKEMFFSSVCRACAESLTSEHSVRLATMQAAESNIDDHLAIMSMSFQQRRQQSITEELMDVIAGSEVLNTKAKKKKSDEIKMEAFKEDLLEIMAENPAI